MPPIFILPSGLSFVSDFPLKHLERILEKLEVFAGAGLATDAAEAAADLVTLVSVCVDDDDTSRALFGPYARLTEVLRWGDDTDIVAELHAARVEVVTVLAEAEGR